MLIKKFFPFLDFIACLKEYWEVIEHFNHDPNAMLLAMREDQNRNPESDIATNIYPALLTYGRACLDKKKELYF